jgi:hypothetical protein
MLDKPHEGWRRETGNASRYQARQRSLNDTEKKMAISAWNTKHSMQPFAPDIGDVPPDKLCPIRSGVAIDSQESLACR